MPRAIAPLVTTITSPPSPCRRASRSHTRASSCMRSSPSPSATTLEPSLTTNRLIMRNRLFGWGAPPGALARVELERDAGDQHLVARLEAVRLELLDHADRAQAVLDVRERVLVVEVEALYEPLDAAAAHGEAAGAELLDVEALQRP